ncbi:relaxase domain-containing protein, partial [Nostocoides sp.]
MANECDDYYLSSGEAPGRWIGAGSERLGLTGEVKADAPRSVIEGVEPSSGEP